eukprot:gene4966-34745_t
MQGSQAKPHVPAHGEGMARAWSWNGTRRARSRTTYTRSAWYAILEEVALHLRVRLSVVCVGEPAGLPPSLVAASAMTKMRVALKRTLEFMALCSVALFCFTIYSRPTEWYGDDQDFKDMRNNMTIYLKDVAILTKVVVKNKTVTQNAGKDATLVSGGSLFPLVLTWAATIGIAVAGAGLLYLFQAQRKAINGDPKPSVTSSPHGASKWSVTCKRLGIMVRQVANYQLPPARFWANWSGGTSVVDALLVAAWVGLATVYLYHNLTKNFTKISEKLTPPPPASVPLVLPQKASELQGYLDNAFVAMRLEKAGKCFGEVLRILLLVLYYPVSRSNVLAWVFRTSHSTLLRYHRWMASGTIIISFFHGLLYVILYGCEGTLDVELTTWEKYKLCNVTGLIALIAALVMAFMSRKWVRQNFYWMFYYTHIVGFVVFTLFAMMHYKGLANWIAPGLVLYVLDLAFRWWQAANNVVHLDVDDIFVNDAVITLKLSWSKGSIVMAGQTVYVSCRQISALQSHPFTLASVAAGDKGLLCAIVHIKVLGQWTRQLRKLALEGKGLRLQVEGPYEDDVLHAPKTSVVVMVAGGIGITPLKGLLETYNQNAVTQKTISDSSLSDETVSDSSVQKATVAVSMDDHDKTAPVSTQPLAVYLIWSCRKICELQLLGPQLLRRALINDKHAEGYRNIRDEGWRLRASLHYTGYEFENIGKQGALCPSTPSGHHLGMQPGTQGPSSLEADIDRVEGGSSLTPKQLLAPSPSISPVTFIPCAILGSFGAFGMLVGLVQFVCFAVGGIVPPMIYLLISKLATAFILSRSPKSECAAPADMVSLVDIAAGVRVDAAYQMSLAGAWKGAWTVGKDDVEEGMEDGMEGDVIQLMHGRPDVKKLLERVVKEHAGELEIEVLVG